MRRRGGPLLLTAAVSPVRAQEAMRHPEPARRGYWVAVGAGA
jgi:hypothetical protein|eukprot:COSAG01_NODE_4072_length_5381_cov_5.718856_6_plen_42_part_00